MAAGDSPAQNKRPPASLPSPGASTPGPNTPTISTTKKSAAEWPRPLTPTKSVPVHGKSRVVLEGGSIDVNGRGTLLTTEECLLSKMQQRNPGMSRADYEKLFSTYLGIKKVIWLGSGVTGDDTHGHVDDITRFVSPGTVVTAVETNAKDRESPAASRKSSPPSRRHRSERQAFECC